MTGISEQKLLEDAKEPALRQVKMDLAVAAIIKAENIEASEEDVEAEYKRMAEQFGMDVDMVKKYLQPDSIRSQVLTTRAVSIVVESATATDPEPPKEEAPAENAEAPAEKPKRTRKKKTEDGEEPEKAEKPKRTRKKKTEDSGEAEKPAETAE